MKRLCAAVLALVLTFTGCRTGEAPTPSFSHTFTDATGAQVTVTDTSRVAVLYGSFAEAWVLGGGRLCGTTEDYVTERGGDTAGITVVGTVKQPNLELLLSLDPTLVILSADIEAQVTLAATLRQMQIPTALMRIDSFADYYAFLQVATDISGQPDLFAAHAVAVADEIDRVKTQVAGKPSPRVLLLRAYSTGVRVKARDNFVGDMLSELGGVHITETYPSLLEELSVEAILQADPDCIFITTMGDADEAIRTFEQTLAASPAWQGLSAVKNGRCYVLPKELFHYKPNARWGEAYRYLAERMY